MAASEDEETQKKGMVRVLNTIGNTNPFNLKAARKIAAILQALPNRCPGIHFCVGNEAIVNALSQWTILMKPSERVRFRTHVGKFKSGLYLSTPLFCSLPPPPRWLQCRDTPRGLIPADDFWYPNGLVSDHQRRRISS